MQDAHAFRGEYIDLCAQIERWAVGIIRSNAALSSGNVGKREPHLLGHKIELIKKLAADSAIFARPKRIHELLTDLQPLLDLRSNLAHAILQNAAEIYVFEVATAKSSPDMSERFWLTPTEGVEHLTELKRIRKELNDQKLAS